MTAHANELLRVEGLSKHFPVVRGLFGKTVGHVRAVDDVSFTLARAETLSLVGESGCGKTTCGRSLLRLIEPTGGRIWFDGTEITTLEQRQMRSYRRRMQIVFQDPFGSLNPRMRVLDILGEGIERHGLASGAGVEAKVRELLERVGLPARSMSRYPHEFSGGQRQRIGIARAIAVAPELIVCDEAVSALDVSIQAQVINLLIDLRREMNLAYLFIAHDLSVVRHISDRVAVMYLGQIVELAPSAALFEKPAHPYTRALLSAIPEPDPRRRRRRLVLTGDVPTPLNPPSGCHFHPRCPAALPRCSEAPPVFVPLDGGARRVRCVHAEGLEDAPDWYTVMSRRQEEAARGHGAQRGAAPVRARVTLERLEPRVAEAAPAAERLVDAAPAQAAATGKALGLGYGGEAARVAPLALRSVALLALALGLGLVSFGSWGFGVVLAVSGYLVAREWEPGWLGRALRGLGPARLALLVAVLALASRWVEPLREVAEAREQLAWLGGELEAYRGNVGHWPATLADLRWRTIERFGNDQPRDPWGNPYQYVVGATGPGYELSSLGPDGTPSGDDVRREP